MADTNLLSIAPQYLNEREASAYLSITVAALRRWRIEKRGPAFIKMSRAVRYSKTDLDAFAEAGRVQGNSYVS